MQWDEHTCVQAPAFTFVRRHSRRVAQRIRISSVTESICHVPVATIHGLPLQINAGNTQQCTSSCNCVSSIGEWGERSVAKHAFA
jgi:hypothetical protein